uniref:Uncharacterized protein n=1 Tax=Oryza nivara TaxID=4536 RepID=A0A0E0GIJ2_ORYNI
MPPLYIYNPCCKKINRHKQGKYQHLQKSSQIRSPWRGSRSPPSSSPSSLSPSPRLHRRPRRLPPATGRRWIKGSHTC